VVGKTGEFSREAGGPPMGRIVTLSLVVLATPMILLLSPTGAEAQQQGPKWWQHQLDLVNSSMRAQVPPKGEGDAYVPPQLKTNFGKTPSTLNLSGNDYMQEPVPDKTGYDEKMWARASRIFPDDGAKRQQWMADQEQRAINRTKPLVYPVSGR
jgi:hypothetical protein